MTQRLRSVFFTILLCAGISAAPLHAQIGFSVPFFNNATQGQMLDIPISVQNFSTILSVQFVIRWDPTVLQFQSVDQFNLPDMDIDNFGLTQAIDSGIVRLVWWQSGSTGVTLPNTASIFHLKLKVIGANNSYSPVYFTEIIPNTYFEVVNANSEIFNLNDVAITNGFVAVGYTVGTSEASNEAPFRVYASPNPMTPASKVWIHAREAQQAECLLTDPTGRIIFSKKIYLSQGENGMEIASYLSGHQGTWYLTVRTPYSTQVLPLASF